MCVGVSVCIYISNDMELLCLSCQKRTSNSVYIQNMHVDTIGSRLIISQRHHKTHDKYIARDQNIITKSLPLKAFHKFLFCSACLSSIAALIYSKAYFFCISIYLHSHRQARSHFSMSFPLILSYGRHMCMTVRLRSAFVIVNFSPNSHRTSENFLFSVCSVQIRIKDQTTFVLSNHRNKSSK